MILSGVLYMIILAKYPSEVWKKVKLSQNFAKVLQSTQDDISKLSVSVALEVKNDTALSNTLALLSRYGADFLVCDVKEGIIIPKEVPKKSKNKQEKKTRVKRGTRKRRKKKRESVEREISSGVEEISEVPVEQHIGSTLEDFF